MGFDLKILCFLFLLWPLFVTAQELNCDVVVLTVVDGDTFKAKVSGKTERVRIAEIDAPELKQPFGQEAKVALTALLYSGKVCLSVRGIDFYNRILADVSVGSISVGRFLVSSGWAWVYTNYSSDVRLLLDEKQAKVLKRGLWQEPSPIKPWIWRKQH